MKLISFIIPVYNAEKTISECLTSILDQQINPREREIIVVDNNSTDQTKNILARFQHEILVLEETKQSRSFARQKGLDHAQGEFIVFVDADTVLEPVWTEHILKIMQERPQIGATQGQIEPKIERWWHALPWHHTRFRTFGTFNLVSIIGTNIIPVIDTAASMWRKEAIQKGFNLNLNRAEDLDLTMRALYSGYSLAGTVQCRAYVKWDKSLFSWFKRFYDQASSEKYVYLFWGIKPQEIIVKNILMHPFWGSLPLIVQFSEVLLIFLHSLGFKKQIEEKTTAENFEIQKVDPLLQTFVGDSFYLGENIRAVFFNDYVALIHLKNLKCYWIYEDEMKWSNKLRKQLIQAKIIIPRQVNTQF